MHLIQVIGTTPPCPRCALMKRMAEGMVAELNIVADVRHVCYRDQEAQSLASALGLLPGTAADVARRLGMDISGPPAGAPRAVDVAAKDEIFKKYNDVGWSSALDASLRPYEMAASKVGVLMTPILVIDGKLRHSGSVPDPGMMRSWLLELDRQGTAS